MAFSDEDLRHLAEYRTAFSRETSDKMIGPDAERDYSDGLYSTRQRGLRVSNRSRKTQKQWKTSSTERSVLRYTIG